MSSQHQGHSAEDPDLTAHSAGAPFASRAFFWLWLANTISRHRGCALAFWRCIRRCSTAAWAWVRSLGALGEHAGLPGTIFAAGLGGGVIALLTRAVQLPAEIGDPSAPAISVPRALSISEEKESFGAPVRRNRSCGLDIENEGGGARVTVFDAADRPPALFAAWQPMRILLIENDPVVCAEHHANA